MAAPQLPPVRISGPIEFLRARLDELEHADWHDGDCHRIPGPSGSCCPARAFIAADVAAKRARITRCEEAAARRGRLEMAQWWEGAMTALWAEVRSDAAAWQRHKDYLPEWKPRPRPGLAPARDRCRGTGD
jgi:uncharacterized protein DUF6221